MTQPFACIITPVFDPAVNALRGLMDDLKQQTNEAWIHVCISNGESPQVKDLIISGGDTRHYYVEVPFELTNQLMDLLLNLGKRREFGLKNFDADRYFFFDADLKLTDPTFLEFVQSEHHTADVLTAKSWFSDRLYPVLPIKLGRIDICNYSFNKYVAKKYHYPQNVYVGMPNDFRFYQHISELSPVKHLDRIFAIKNGRTDYKTLTDIYHEVNGNYIRLIKRPPAC